ncbi:hypothetical protein [Lacisediminihabitans profunda]|uniref:Uncharacterized protein n=1 Tax=Lacisediminihabitans profunda TaxID=2594790 RepID=A0A5C8UR19_9MICO|nr:hypothetical protein [Lacisediminihabitans profunda]TXN29897.1 hypothetical protein FVP33_12225 [Lacisediminihabitans profunda]
MRSTRVWPASALGWWGLGLILAFAALFVLKSTVGAPIPTFAIFALGIVGAVLGVVAVIRRDLSWVLIAIGSLVILFMVVWVGGELLFPH